MNTISIIRRHYNHLQDMLQYYSTQMTMKRLARRTQIARLYGGYSESKLTPSEAGQKAHDLAQQQRSAAGGVRTRLHMDTILSHAGLSPPSSYRFSSSEPIQEPKSQNEPLSPPLHLASTYERPPDGNYGSNGLIYSRSHNPTRMLLERVLTELETTHADNNRADRNVERIEDGDAPFPSTCSTYSSGMAAVSALLLSCPHHQRVHVILPDDVYHGVPTQLMSVLKASRGVTCSVVNMCDNSGGLWKDLEQEVERQMETDESVAVMVWMESPSNPLCQVTDIAAICSLVQDIRTRRSSKSGEKDDSAAEGLSSSSSTIVTVVDSTWAPPCITQPLLLGADVVLHSATKYLGGHSDVLLGAIITSPYTPQGCALAQSLKTTQTTIGAVASPLECWLTLRGLRTLHLRLQRQCDSAMKLASFLSAHHLVEKVHYPGMITHPNHDIAMKQMKRGMYGGMLSFELRDECMAMAVAGAVGTVKRGTSLGGTETLVEHRASIEPSDRVTSPLGLLRVSVGLEEVEDLICDFEFALRIAWDVVGDD